MKIWDLLHIPKVVSETGFEKLRLQLKAYINGMLVLERE